MATRFLLSLLLLAPLFGCGGSGGSSNGVGTLRVEVTDAFLPHSEVSEARIDVSAIRIHRSSAEDESGFITLYEGDPVAINLLDLQNGVTDVLVDSEVGAGTYRQVRLLVSSAFLRLNNGNEYSTEEGTLTLTSQASSGFKFFIDPAIEVRGGFSTTLLLDVNLVRTFHPIPANDPLNASRYSLAPVVRAVNRSEAGEIRGLVSAEDGEGDQVPVEGATVFILPPGETDLDNNVASTATDANGDYAVIGLPAESYDVVAMMDALEGRIDAQSVGAGSFTVVDLLLE